MSERVRITDVSPRDGLQNEPARVPTADKVRLIEFLCATGVDEVEATSFVSPKWIPQLGDAEDVLASLELEAGREGPALSALVPNEKGFERALAIHQGGRPLKIAVFTAASETFSRKNTNASIAETIERFGVFLPRAFEAGMAVRMYVSCAVACPFEGAIEPGAVRRVTDALLALAPGGGVDVEIDLGDTIGAATPESLSALLDAFPEEAMRRRIALHLHDTFGRAASCVRRGLELGVRRFDGAVAGIGGCPYAGTPEKPAPGNIDTELLVGTIHDAGFETGVDMDALKRAGDFARQILAQCRAAAVKGGAS
ncbi:MAG: hydroxymethylglutaryl-CoA lyase [Phycisphaeraceae bacterium]|nr:MAG: hydroxymethylglutaryl-CoA lyase [Phycisphaeraceae bacterium]